MQTSPQENVDLVTYFPQWKTSFLFAVSIICLFKFEMHDP